MATMSENSLRLLPRPILRSAAAVLGLVTCGVFLAEPNLAAQVTAPQAPSAALDAEPPTTALMQADPLIIASGDLLQLQVFATPELSGPIRVDQFGNLNLALGGSLHVTGMTAAEASEAIEDRLKSSRIMRDPHVSVAVTQYNSQIVTVVGEVKKPGATFLYGSQSLYDVLGAAGGVTNSAGGTITISHYNDPSPPQVIPIHTPNYSAVEHTTHIRRGDTVVVSQADVVYVIGAVNKQGAIPMPNGAPLSLLNVVSLSSGLTLIAATSKAAIVRQGPNGVIKTVNVDLKRVMQRKDPDILMEASDILVVPVSTGKYLGQLVLPSVASTSLSSVVTSLIVR
jgi:polysaccharide biosynthesis/export protein